MKSWTFLHAEEWIRSMNPSKEDAQDHDVFISLTGILNVIVNSRKDKAKSLKERTLKNLVPRDFNARIAEIERVHW